MSLKTVLVWATFLFRVRDCVVAFLPADAPMRVSFDPRAHRILAPLGLGFHRLGPVVDRLGLGRRRHVGVSHP